MTQYVEKQREFFLSKKTLSYGFRLNALRRLREGILKYEDELHEALQKDLSKSKSESYMTEIGIVLKELRYHERKLKKHMKRRRVKTSLSDFPSNSFIQPSPYGVVLIISPWNYPVNLSLTPLIGAIAAGNAVIIKPSEYSVHTSKVLAELIEDTFDSDYIRVVNGGVETNQALLDEKFDYIFFTGSTAVGKIVMEKASKHLTPISLELGGKSPTIVDESANIDMAAKRIAFGKHVNSGQTCIAPDYLFIHENVKEKFLDKYKQYVTRFYDEPLTNNQFGSIISERHFERLISLYKEEKILHGGKFNSENKKIEPTVVEVEDMTSPIMKEEIFGPILPVITFNRIDEVILHINQNSSPLALYLFTTNAKNEERVLNECQFGGGCVNDTIVHIANDHLPFGGVGQSGMGSYHGSSSFATFSHYKSVLKKHPRIDLPVRYAPFSKEKDNIIRRFLR